MQFYGMNENKFVGHKFTTCLSINYHVTPDELFTVSILKCTGRDRRMAQFRRSILSEDEMN